MVNRLHRQEIKRMGCPSNRICAIGSVTLIFIWNLLSFAPLYNSKSESIIKVIAASKSESVTEDSTASKSQSVTEDRAALLYAYLSKGKKNPKLSCLQYYEPNILLSGSSTCTGSAFARLPPKENLFSHAQAHIAEKLHTSDNHTLDLENDRGWLWQRREVTLKTTAALLGGIGEYVSMPVLEDRHYVIPPLLHNQTNVVARLILNVHAALLRLLLLFDTIAAAFDVKYVLGGGNLIGAYVDKRILQPWDLDIDIHIEPNGFKKLVENKFWEFLPPDIYYFNRNPRNIYNGLHKLKDPHICYFYNKKDSSNIFQPDMLQLDLTVGDPLWSPFIRWDDIDYIDAYGHNFSVPGNIQGILTAIYGQRSFENVIMKNGWPVNIPKMFHEVTYNTGGDPRNLLLKHLKMEACDNMADMCKLFHSQALLHDNFPGTV